MDGLIVLLIALVLLVRYPPAEKVQAQEIPKERIVVNPALNPTMHHDENAFMSIANELGFH